MTTFILKGVHPKLKEILFTLLSSEVPTKEVGGAGEKKITYRKQFFFLPISMKEVPKTMSELTGITLFCKIAYYKIISNRHCSGKRSHDLRSICFRNSSYLVGLS